MIKWHLETKLVKDLIPNPQNPRRLTKNQALQLELSLDKFGIAEPIIINTNNMIIGGHQRVSLLKEQEVSEIWCSVPDHELSDDEVNELCIRLNKNTGEWDFDMLANTTDPNDLLQFGFSCEELVGLSPAELVEPIEEKEQHELVTKCPECGQKVKQGK